VGLVGGRFRVTTDQLVPLQCSIGKSLLTAKQFVVLEQDTPVNAAWRPSVSTFEQLPRPFHCNPKSPWDTIPLKLPTAKQLVVLGHDTSFRLISPAIERPAGAQVRVGHDRPAVPFQCSINAQQRVEIGSIGWPLLCVDIVDDGEHVDDRLRGKAGN
jgi:hypothetical protein